MDLLVPDSLIDLSVQRDIAPEFMGVSMMASRTTSRADVKKNLSDAPCLSVGVTQSVMKSSPILLLSPRR